MGKNKIRLLSTIVFSLHCLFNLLHNLKLEEEMNRKSEVILALRPKDMVIFTGFT